MPPRSEKNISNNTHSRFHWAKNMGCNIKSGVYLYILEAGGTTKSGKLIIQ